MFLINTVVTVGFDRRTILATNSFNQNRQQQVHHNAVAQKAATCSKNVCDREEGGVGERSPVREPKNSIDDDFEFVRPTTASAPKKLRSNDWQSFELADVFDHVSSANAITNNNDR